MFNSIPLNQIQPQGWWAEWLARMSKGLSGHVEVAGYPFNTKGWAEKLPLQGAPESWWPYEQVAYWLEGGLCVGHWAGNKKLLGRVEEQLGQVLKRQRSDGLLGPEIISKTQWPHVVLFRALMAWHEITADERIVKAMAAHYRFCKGGLSGYREVCHIEPMAWCYGKDPDAALLRQIKAVWQNFNAQASERSLTQTGMLGAERPSGHGVTYCEVFKLPAILYGLAAQTPLVRASQHALEKLVQDHELVDGVVSAAEGLDGRHALASHETCVIADYTWSLGHVFLASGEVALLDKIERAVFNAGFGAVTKDFRALQYFSCPNQVVAAGNSNHNLFHGGESWMRYAPNPATACCVGNVHRIFPNYLRRLFMRQAEDVLVAGVFGPCSVSLCVHGQAVTINEKTSYPFEDRVRFVFSLKDPLKFTFKIRLPAWCTAPEILVNGQKQPGTGRSGRFYEITRLFSDQDQIELFLPAAVRQECQTDGTVSFVRGPLVYSLPIAERRLRDNTVAQQNTAFPAWEMFPESPFNYAVAKGNAGAARFCCEPRECFPWDSCANPYSIDVSAHRIKGYGLCETRAMIKYGPDFERVRVRGHFLLTPNLPDAKALRRRLCQREEIIKLVPMGTTLLRQTVLPGY